MINLLLVLSALVGVGLGQNSSAVCSDKSLNWSFNSKKQSPCLVAAILVHPCNDPSITDDVPAIPKSGLHYHAADGDPCICNTVAYSLLSACTLCQGFPAGNWTDFRKNCSSVPADGTFGSPLPAGAAVPHWATQKVIKSNNFNAGLAKSAGDTPENVPSGASGSTSAAPSTTTASSTDTATSDTASDTSSNTASVTSPPASSTTNAGSTTSASASGTGAAGRLQPLASAGSVVSGVIVLAVIAASSFLVI